MKIEEMTSAEDQLALWKLINQSVWAALEQQQAEQQRAAQWERAKAAAKPRGKKRAATADFQPVPLPSPPFKVQGPTSKPTTTMPVNSPSKQRSIGANMDAVAQLAVTKSALNHTKDVRTRPDQAAK